MTLLERARGLIDRTLAGARPYRFPDEQANHADLLRERRVSLSMMAGAEAENPDQQRMASEIEHDAEARLTVLLGKPQLTLEEKRERDAIQTALQQRRAGFGDAPVLVARTGGWAPPRFLGALGGIQLWQALAVGWAVTFGLLGVQTARISSLKSEARDLRADVASVERHLANEREIRERLAEEVRAADLLSQQTAANLEAERARSRASAAAERRRQRALREVDTGGGPPDWERSLRNVDPVEGQTGSSSGGAPTGNPG